MNKGSPKEKPLAVPHSGITQALWRSYVTTNLTWLLGMCEITGFNDCLAGVQVCFGSVSIFLLFSFGIAMFSLLAILNFFFSFIGVHNWKFDLSFRRDSELELFSNTETTRTLENLRNRLNQFCMKGLA